MDTTKVKHRWHTEEVGKISFDIDHSAVAYD